MLKRENFPDHDSSSHWYSGFKPKTDTPLIPSFESEACSKRVDLTNVGTNKKLSLHPLFASQMTFAAGSSSEESEPSSFIKSVSSSNILYSKLPKSQVKNSLFKRKMIKQYMQNPKFSNWKSGKVDALKSLRTLKKDMLSTRRGSASKNLKFHGVKSFKDGQELLYFDLVYDQDAGFKEKWQSCFIEFVLY